MKPRALQHALVRMFYDPVFAEAVRGRGAVDGLDERERALLRRVDPRALTSDPYRRARAIHALVDEFPVSAAALGLQALDSFFSSPAFRTCVERRGSMALAFATWLEDRAGGAGRIEAAGAQLRRRAPAPPSTVATPLLRCAPHIAPLVVPEGSLAWYEATRAWLGEAPLTTLADAPPRPGAPRHGPGEHLVLEHVADNSLSLGTASEPLVRLLRFAEHPRTRRALTAEALARGADAAEVDELLDSLIADGLLVRTIA